MPKKTKYFPPKNLNLFFLILMNISMIGGLKSWVLVGGFGLLSIVFFLLVVIIFLMPGALVAAELGSSMSKPGGIYLWVKEAFGHRLGFLVIWIFWLEIIFWVPIPLVKSAYIFSFAVNPALANQIFFQLTFTLLLLWGATFGLLYGMRIFRWISSFAVILGIFLPGIIIIALGFYYFFGERGVAQSFSITSVWDDMLKLENWVLFAGILFSIEGVEATAVHMSNIKDPQKNYPKAILYSVLLLCIFYILGAISMEIIFPKEITIVFEGSLKDIAAFVSSFQLNRLFFFMMFMVTIGIFAAIINWLIIPVRGLLEVAKYGDLPPVFQHTNKYGMPSTLIIMQALIVSVITILFILFPLINVIYWVFLAIASILYLIVYMLIFASAIRLRYKKPQLPRPFAISKGKLGIWIVAGCGFLTSLIVFFFSFLVPEQTIKFSRMSYFPWFALILILICLGPSIILLFKKPSWKRYLEEEDTLPIDHLDQK